MAQQLLELCLGEMADCIHASSLLEDCSSVKGPGSPGMEAIIQCALEESMVRAEVVTGGKPDDTNSRSDCVEGAWSANWWEVSSGGPVLSKNATMTCSTLLEDQIHGTAAVSSHEAIFEGQDPDICSHFLQLPAGVEVHICQDEDSLRFMANALKGERFVGVDCEWKPNLDLFGSNRVSLLQVATRKHVFLLDLHGLLLSPAPPSSPSSPLPVPLRLPDASRQAALDSLFAPLFLGSCIKIGYRFFHDLEKLAESYPDVSQFRECHNVLDLGDLARHPFISNELLCTKSTSFGSAGSAGSTTTLSPSTLQVEIARLQEGYESVLVQSPEARSLWRVPCTSLSELCDHFLGAPVNKQQQLSNWEHRPLSAAQIDYASVDAHCLLPLFARMAQSMEHEGWDVEIEDFVNHLHLDRLGKCHRQMQQERQVSAALLLEKKATSTLGATPGCRHLKGSALPPSQDPADFDGAPRLFLVDNMLCRLARCLRNVGIDTFFFPGKSLREQLQIARRERRILLTNNRSVFLKKSTGIKWYFVRGDSGDEQLEDILAFFSIPLLREDGSHIPSRCISCNHDHFRKLPLKAVQHRLPVKTATLGLYDVFFECKFCRKLYWEGEDFSMRIEADSSSDEEDA